jgi:hypothetical protein
LSSEKTTNLQLNKWVPTDYVKMDEFNENFDIIDEKIGDLNKKTEDVINIKEFGAKGDGVTDDSDAIQNAINSLSENGGTIIFPKGVYLISKPLKLYSDIVIEGNNSIFKASDNGWTDYLFRGILELVGVSRVVIRNLFIDHNCSASTNPKPSYCVFMFNASENLLDNVVFSDSGSINSLPSDPPLMILAKDDPSEFSDQTASVYANITGGCYDNVIRKCTFQLPKTARCAFAVRVLTDWVNKRPLDNFVNHNQGNVFDSCKFVGDYKWNHLEFAGGGTRYNKVVNCYFNGLSLTAIDFDKGTNYNIAIGNTVENVGRSQEYLSQSDTRMAAINVHGYQATTGDTDIYYSIGNTVINNVIKDVGNVNDTDSYQSSIGVGYAQQTVVSGNQIDCIKAPTGFGIFIDHYTDNLLVEGNIIRNVAYGIGFNANASTIGSVTIKANDVYIQKEAVSLGGQSGGNTRVTISDNTLKTTSTTDKCIVLLNFIKKAIISNNRVLGGLECISCYAQSAVILGNICDSPTQRGIRIGDGKAVLIGNRVINSALADLIVSSSIQPTLVGNSFTNPASKEGPNISYMSSVPNSGIWNKGDIVYNTNPVAGGKLGWVCVVSGDFAGTPPVFKAFGAIDV